MRRPLVWMAVPVCLYCILGAVIRINFLFLLIASVIIFSLLISRSKKSKYKRFFIFMAIFSVFSLSCISFNAGDNTFVSLLDQKGTAVDISGRVKRINVYDDYMYVQLTSVKVDAKTDKAGLKGILLKAPYKKIGYGDVIEASGTITPLKKAENEGNFDEKAYYESIGIEAVLKAKEKISVKKKGNAFYRIADKARRHFKASFERVSPNHKGELSSVIIGDKSDMDSEIRELYSENGIAHILAISGLHISFSGMAVYRLLRKAGVSLAGSGVLAGIIVVFYVVMTGSSISAWRACVMFIIAAAADALGRSYDSPSALSVQAIITLLVTPMAIKGASFIMSYMAVLSIIIAGEAFGNVLYRLKGNLTALRILLSNVISAFFVFFFMLPVNLYFYHSIPTYSLLLNLIVIPLSSVLMPLGVAAGILGNIWPAGGIFFAGGAEKIFEIYSGICRLAQNAPFAKITPGVPGMVTIIIFYIFVAWSFYIWKLHIEDDFKRLLGDPSCTLKELVEFLKRKLYVIVVGVAPALVITFFMTRHKNHDFFISMICVGQGDCILVHTNDGHNLLFDGGSSNVRDVYKKRIRPYLQYTGINKIDMIIVSHTDSDHVNGLVSLMQESNSLKGSSGGLRVGSVVLPDVKDELKDEFYYQLEKISAGKHIDIEYACEGMTFSGSDFKLSCLSPKKGESGSDKNELSAVFKFSDKNISMLFTGDMTQDSEKRLLQKKADVSADILKVAHHGSNYSSCSEFLEAVSPKLGLISCDETSYGHPGKETMKRFEKLNIPVFVTKECGQIFVEKNKGNYNVRTLL